MKTTWNLTISINRPNHSVIVEHHSNVPYPQDGGLQLATQAAQNYNVRLADVSISFAPVLKHDPKNEGQAPMFETINQMSR